MRKRRHPDHYYTIRDAVIPMIGPVFSQAEYYRSFPKAAAVHGVIPYTDSYLTHRRIIKLLVKAKMR